MSPIVQLPGDSNYHTHLFSCHRDIPSCITSCICPSIVVAQTRNEFDNSGFCMNWGPIVIIDHCVGVGSCLFGLMYRQEYRDKYNIQGSALADCCIFTWCTCCAVAQDAREIRIRNGQESKLRQVMVAPQPVATAFQSQNFIPQPQTFTVPIITTS
mmetsp:Transcript_22329/g.36927  ORF Transcript_22329/g.36927 Transcript_22329/m.36927 type:complete len:156 (+) Transcript_22329:247-714(+)